MTEQQGSIESRILSTALRSKKVGFVITRLNAEHFTGVNRKVFNYLREQWGSHSTTPSLKFIQEKFPTFAVQRQEKQADLTYLIAELKERSTMAAVIETVRETTRIVSKPSAKSSEAVSFLEGQLNSLRSYEAETNQFNMRSQAVDFLNNDYRTIQRKGGMLGFATGIEAIDKPLHGFKTTELVTLLGFAGEGKTYLSLLITGLIWKAGIDSVLFSLEMDSETVARRLYAVMAGISIEDYISGNLTDDEIDRLESLAEDVQNWPAELIIDDDPLLTVDSFKSKMRSYRGKFACIDYLQLMQSFINDSKRFNINESFDLMIRGLKLAAKELDVCILGNAQAGKDAGGTGAPPTLSQIRGGMPISMHADVIMSFCRNGANYDGKFLKNRNAIYLPSFKLKWDPGSKKGLRCESSIVKDFNPDI